MRAVVQRVVHADVSVAGETTGTIEKGLMVLLGVGESDTDKDAEYMAEKVCGLRIFEDEDDKMNLSVQDVGGDILAVSQFTLYGDVKKGKRPSFSTAARPDEANRLYRYFIDCCKKRGLKVEEGIFQAEMLVKIHNDGPVTILIDSQKTF
ncbi:MAG: D-tyrosyl-tRNA(Tyr) deacylase [Firmicutes bacterium]|nr:D-tyrosyl-tRNA(Tyr) deacylase [Bacillota bacterium]